VSGTNFTTVAEFNDAPAPAGAGVVLVATRGSHERFLQSPEVDEQRAPSGINAADFYWGPFYKMTPLDQSAWTWFNQGGSVVIQGGGLVYLAAPGGVGGTNLRGRLQGSYPATPFTLIAGISHGFQAATSITNLSILGIAISDGTKFKIFVVSNFNFNTANPPPAIWVGKYNTFSAAVSASVAAAELRDVLWLKVEDDGVNQTFSFSWDKRNWVVILQEARTTHLTPSDIGIVVTNQSGTVESGGNIISWELT
jgi:hypothetical protein